MSPAQSVEFSDKSFGRDPEVIVCERASILLPLPVDQRVNPPSVVPCLAHSAFREKKRKLVEMRRATANCRQRHLVDAGVHPDPVPSATNWPEVRDTNPV